MKQTINIIGMLVGLAMVGYFGYALLKDGMDKNEIVECQQWESQAAQFSGFYLVQWQADQCKAHNIIINAPVK